MSKLPVTRSTNSYLPAPFGRFRLAKTVFDDLLDQMLTEGGGPMSEAMSTAMDVAETDQAYEVKMDLPGVKPGEVDIQIENNALTVRGSRTEEKEETNKEKRYHRVERSSGSFSRSVVLPSVVDESKAVAEFKDGVLVITVPKSEAAKPRKISVKG